MKKLGKLSINPDKIIKNEELVNLRGGYDDKLFCECIGVDGAYDLIPFVGCWATACAEKCDNLQGSNAYYAHCV